MSILTASRVHVTTPADAAEDLAAYYGVLDLLLAQRPDCLNLPLTLAELDAKIDAATDAIEALGGRAFEPTEADWEDYSRWAAREEAEWQEVIDARDATYHA